MTELRSSDIAIELIGENGFGLFAQFWKQDDRYCHELGIIDGGQKVVLLTSVEGSPEEFWPPCPPIQQVYKQTVDDNPVLLGVGMAGNRHYSTSALLKPVNASVELVVESACLIKEPLEHKVDLETRYQSNQIWKKVGDHDWRTEVAGRAFAIEPMTRTGLMVDNHQSMLIQFQADQIEIGSATQWGYRLVLA